jgi:hypothetical protein
MIVVSMPIVDGVGSNESNDHFQQMANQVYTGLKDRGLDVIYLGTNGATLPTLDPQKDFAVCDWTRRSFSGLPRNRTILLDNHNFNYQNLNGFYAKYGLHVPTNTSALTRPDLRHELTGLRGAVFMSNDVAINNVATYHPDIRENYDWWKQNVGNRLKIVPHPINKPLWTQYFNPNVYGPKILVYHKPGKNSLRYIGMLNRLGYQAGIHYDITDWVYKDKPQNISLLNQQYHAIVNCSYSETGPINMIEYQMQGLLVIGCEEWWTGCGEGRTMWTYDQRRERDMANNIRWLLDPRNAEEIRQIRNRIHAEQVARKDNEWNYTIDKLIECMI